MVKAEKLCGLFDPFKAICHLRIILSYSLICLLSWHMNLLLGMNNTLMFLSYKYVFTANYCLKWMCDVSHFVTREFDFRVVLLSFAGLHLLETSSQHLGYQWLWEEYVGVC